LAIDHVFSFFTSSYQTYLLHQNRYHLNNFMWLNSCQKDIYTMLPTDISLADI